MNISIVAVILAVACASFTEVTADGPCTTLYNKKLTDCFKGKPPPPGANMPTCDDSGFFAKKQCWASTGYCKCVYTDTGNQYTYSIGPGTDDFTCNKNTQDANAITIGPCADELHLTAPSTLLLGAKKPQCDSIGNYLPLQKNPSTGYSQCVYTNTGRNYGDSVAPGNPEPICNIKKDTNIC